MIKYIKENYVKVIGALVGLALLIREVLNAFGKRKLERRIEELETKEVDKKIADSKEVSDAAKRVYEKYKKTFDKLDD